MIPSYVCDVCGQACAARLGGEVVPLTLSAQNTDGGRNVGSSVLLPGMHMSEERTNISRGLATLLDTEARATSLKGARLTMAGPPLGPAVVLFAGDGMTVLLLRVSPSAMQCCNHLFLRNYNFSVLV